MMADDSSKGFGSEFLLATAGGCEEVVGREALIPKGSMQLL
jgi:hypothetical protein